MSSQADIATRSYGPYARSAPLPRHLDDVTRDWFASVLANKYPGIAVTGFERVELRNSHTTKLRVAVTYNEVGVAAGLPSRLCLKANWSDGFDSADICALEARFYHELREGADLPAAKCYYADWDDDGSGQGVIVLEDLGDAGGLFGHSSQLIGVDGVAHALGHLARIHGAYWGKLDHIDWLPRAMDTPVDTNQLRMMWFLVSENLARDVYIARLPRWINEDHDRFLKVYDLLNLYARRQTGPRCLVHGDSHLGNTYLKADGERIWLDWQLARAGHAVRDVSYLMTGALTIDERRGNERTLIAHYLAALAATGAQDVPDADTFWEQYRRWPIYGLQAWLGIKDWWGQDGLPAIERFVAAAEDLDSLRLLEAEG